MDSTSTSGTADFTSPVTSSTMTSSTGTSHNIDTGTCVTVGLLVVIMMMSLSLNLLLLVSVCHQPTGSVRFNHKVALGMLVSGILLAVLLLPTAIILLCDVTQTGDVISCRVILATQLFVCQNYVISTNATATWNYILVKYALHAPRIVTSRRVALTFVAVGAFSALFAYGFFLFYGLPPMDASRHKPCTAVLFETSLTFVLCSTLLVVVPCVTVSLVMSVGAVKIINRHR